MKPILLPVFILVQAALYGQLSWVQKDSLPSLGRYNHVSFVIGNLAMQAWGPSMQNNGSIPPPCSGMTHQKITGFNWPIFPAEAVMVQQPLP